MADLADLIARLEKAEGPSRGLDVAVWWHLYPDSPAFVDVRFDDGPTIEGVPRYTSSLDAALPWEKIVTMVYCNGSYECQQANAFGRGGVHKFEAIARRITALKAREAGNA